LPRFNIGWPIHKVTLVLNMLPDDLVERLKNIRLIVLDVDGVLTDGRIIYAGSSIESKEFHVQDGFGITLGRQGGLKFGVITGRVSEAVKKRVTELKFDFYESGHFYKRDALLSMMDSSSLGRDGVLYMGDEILDLVCKGEVNVFVAPANAVTRVKQEADWVTQRVGGDAAVREVIDAVLEAQGLLRSTQDFFISPRS
jgi:3-deoxy-D-manno-octulosonate 8-phosphate phosphatase (KDO 8-P phosphatase)